VKLSHVQLVNSKHEEKQAHLPPDCCMYFKRHTILNPLNRIPIEWGQ